jgi:hypothetical protein
MKKNPIFPPPSPCHTFPPLPYRELPACPQLGTWREMEKKCQQIHTQGVAQETGTQDKRKDPKLSLEEPGPAWSCSPSQRKGRKRPHGERESGAFPDTHSQGPPEVQVEEVLHLMSDRNIYIYIYLFIYLFIFSVKVVFVLTAGFCIYCFSSGSHVKNNYQINTE